RSPHSSHSLLFVDTLCAFMIPRKPRAELHDERFNVSTRVHARSPTDTPMGKTKAPHRCRCGADLRARSLAVLVPAAVLVDRDKFVLTQQTAVALLGCQGRLDVLVVAFEARPLLVVVGDACVEVDEAHGDVVVVAAGDALSTRAGRVDVAQQGTVLGRVLRRRGVLDEGELLAAHDLVEPLLSLVVTGL